MSSKTLTVIVRLVRHCLYKPRVFRVNPVRLYYGSPQTVTGSAIRTVDLRSDTVTKPGAAMRRAMAEAEVGDDVFGEDPTVNELQKIAAEMFGMKAALYVPSGTMSNLIAVMVHCRERGDEMIAGDLSHIHIYEQGGSAQLRSVADQFGLAVHMDGARVMNAAVALGVQPSAILQHCHSVSVCLSKGLGAPVGSMLGGSKDFIQRAVRVRKVLGGGMRQLGILAAAGKIALSDMIGRLEEDHRNARHFAQALLESDPALYQVDLNTVQTNIVRFSLREGQMSPVEFCERMAGVDEEEVKALGQGVPVLMFPHVGDTVRAVWHLGISEEDTQLAILKAQFVAQQHKRRSIRAA
ncbi:threonine aldolase 1 isoform X1 [Danio rerio]|uniref:Threonine aldolase 1 isoform X1 n=2 Tax=Danio rerio TaxID=7955 RepID=A0A8M3AYK8_DANRE|nr:threonine aldolase 1 isoform X1 [Danio rerio]|eukprot:XP_009305089.1 threonine aldolase 1 isoform X1 [Danio rerio]